MNKIDLIIDALERANELWLTEPMGEKAIAAAYELKAELAKPVAYYNKKYDTVITAYELGNHVDGNDVPLYALEVTK
jgi:hypothetical protein